MHQRWKYMTYGSIISISLIGIAAGLLAPSSINPWSSLAIYSTLLAAWLIASYRLNRHALLAGAMTLFSAGTGFVGGIAVALIMALVALGLAGIALGDITINLQDL